MTEVLPRPRSLTSHALASRDRARRSTGEAPPNALGARRWALGEVRATHGEVPVVLLGHYMVIGSRRWHDVALESSLEVLGAQVASPDR